MEKAEVQENVQFLKYRLAGAKPETAGMAADPRASAPFAPLSSTAFFFVKHDNVKFYYSCADH